MEWIDRINYRLRRRNLASGLDQQYPANMLGPQDLAKGLGEDLANVLGQQNQAHKLSQQDITNWLGRYCLLNGLDQ